MTNAGEGEAVAGAGGQGTGSQWINVRVVARRLFDRQVGLGNEEVHCLTCQCVDIAETDTAHYLTAMTSIILMSGSDARSSGPYCPRAAGI
jgi:hypothetical protein